MKFFRKVESGVNVLLGLMGLSGIVVMTMGVIARYCLKISINWSDEYLRTMFIWTYFIGAAMLYATGGLMRLELLDDFFDKRGMKKAKKVVNSIIELLFGGYCGFMAYYVVQLTCTYIEKGTTSSTSKVPAWVLILGMGIGFVLLVIMAIRNVIRNVKSFNET